ncbi:MAG: sortase [Candidatus Absconditabacterales bacterium]
MHGLSEHYLTQPQKRSFRQEIRTFVLFFVAVFVIILVFTNFNLFASNFLGLFEDEIHPSAPISASIVSEDNNISSIVDTAQKDDVEIQGLLKNYQQTTDANTLAPSTEETLQSHLMDYDFSFNTVPPVNRIIVPSLGLDVPIVTNENMAPVVFAKADFDKELNEGVVKYPTTPAPGQEGNTLLFGHTSYVVWKTNPYGTIFKDLPKLKDSTLIQILREGNLYEYKVIDLFIVSPKQVNAQYMTYQNAGGSYITLMGCYPLGTDNKRIMVVAKLIDK